MVSKGKGHIQGRQAQTVLAMGLKNWRKAAQAARHTDLSELKRQRNRARRLKVLLDDLLHVADERLTLPLPGNHSFPRPHDCDWHWRPALWRGALPMAGLSSAPQSSSFGDEVKLFHDCPLSEITLRQMRNTREADLAAYALRLDVLGFEGSYMSLSIDLPEEAAKGLTRSHVIRIDSTIETEQRTDMHVRLNLQQGPNTIQTVRTLPADTANMQVEFDLAYLELNEKRLEKIWIDLMFDHPQLNQIVLRDLTVMRRKRAEI